MNEPAETAYFFDPSFFHAFGIYIFVFVVENLISDNYITPSRLFEPNLDAGSRMNRLKRLISLIHPFFMLLASIYLFLWLKNKSLIIISLLAGLLSRVSTLVRE